MTYRGAYDTPDEPCPYCGSACEADFVDVGVGMVQCGPYHCENCNASEIGPEACEDGFSQTITAEERETGWYKSGKVSPLANTVDGVLVDHKTAKVMYDLGLLDEKELGEL